MARGRRVRWIRAADRVFGGADRYRRFIVDLGSISPAPRSMKYRRYIGDIYRRFIKCNIFIYVVRLQYRARGAHALRAAIEGALGIKKHNTAGPMHHRRSLRDHPHGRAKGPWGPRGRLS